ncbi:MAG: hypothetical protein CEO21_172 [Microgenomates group bacterium Gr01-1014_80]|nr:MAG: hypothetical protein CEO21_172 [Microgenomates group bacterium Gr01-1014_80]
MSAIAEVGTVLEQFGKKLQVVNTPKEPVTPYEHAKKLWETLTSGRKIDSVEAAYLRFHYNSENGIRPENVEQNLLGYLLRPYRGLFPELETFTTSISIGDKDDDISFKLTVFAPPPSPQFNQNKGYPVLTIRELPEVQRGVGDHKIPYKMLILGEGDLYTGRLSQELVEFNFQSGPLWNGLEEWSDELRGDVEWRKRFTCEAIKYFTRIAEMNPDLLSEFNRGVQSHFRKQEKAVSWWSRTWGDRLHPGAVWPETLNLYYTRVGLIGHSPSRLVAKLQQA